MKSILAVVSALVLMAAAASAASVTVKLEGVSPKGGTLKVAAYDAANFAANTAPLASVKLAAQPGEMTVILDKVPDGEIAVKVLQDLNDNGRMDYTMGFIPAEPYGFSNNPEIKMGPPSWDETKFMVKPGANTITIRMK